MLVIGAGITLDSAMKAHSSLLEKGKLLLLYQYYHEGTAVVLIHVLLYV